MKIVFFLALFVNLFFGYEAYQNTASSPQASYHPLYEERRNRLLGVYGTFNKVESDANLNISGFASQNHDLSEKPFGFGLQMGYLLSQNHRILVNFENTLKKNGFSYRSLTLGYAFTPRIPSTQKWRLLLGVNAGIAFGSFDSGSFVINDSAMGKLDYTGLTYGVKAGAIYETRFGELEFGIQSRRLDFGDESSSVIINDTPTGTNLDLSETSNTGFFFGYNFLF
ncbi:hypothetical protein HPU229334_12040 [Helicobacter pullorum]|uniref:Outer membrane protein n=1 Tax=Helicobacter pullorum TaxID=35818 RepID=A0A0N0LT48_9HELI|nr:hypothetical protein [Helicobacter pullorum]KPH54799.1 hypothetical protein HPU229334_12040 [Helicobacter pullorum]